MRSTEGLTRFGEGKHRECRIRRAGLVHRWQRWFYQWDQLGHVDGTAVGVSQDVVHQLNTLFGPFSPARPALTGTSRTNTVACRNPRHPA
jgi:hypothetical protein